jgi:hypothetical protein
MPSSKEGSVFCANVDFSINHASVRSLVLLLHQALLVASATGPYLFSPFFGHLYLSVKRKNFPFTVQYDHTNIRSESVTQPFLFPLLHFLVSAIFPSLHAELGDGWTGYLFTA